MSTKARLTDSFLVCRGVCVVVAVIAAVVFVLALKEIIGASIITTSQYILISQASGAFTGAVLFAVAMRKIVKKATEPQDVYRRVLVSAIILTCVSMALMAIGGEYARMHQDFAAAIIARFAEGGEAGFGAIAVLLVILWYPHRKRPTEPTA